jgi:GR25 family glycosyltransferase involved in LPS biosynthesis
MKLHIINLIERTDRKDHMKQQVEKLNIDYEFVQGIRGNNSWGAGMSHCNCINLAQEKNMEMILVCEDDVLLNENTMVRLENLLTKLPEDWDIFLGGASGLENCVKINSLFFKVGDFSGLHFVVYRRKSYDKILKWLTTKKYRVFRRLARPPHIDRYLGNLSQKGKLNIYAPFYFLADTINSYSDVRGGLFDDTELFQKVEKYLENIK